MLYNLYNYYILYTLCCQTSLSMLYSLYKEVVKMAKTENFVRLGLSDKLLKKIEDFQFDNRIKSRSEAIRILIEKGLEK